MSVYTARIDTNKFHSAIADATRTVFDQRGISRALIAAGYAPPLVETIILEIGRNGAAAILQDEDIVEVIG